MMVAGMVWQLDGQLRRAVRRIHRNADLGLTFVERTGLLSQRYAKRVRKAQ